MAELFGNFEINRVPRWPLMSRLLAGSIVLHGLFLVAMAYVPTLQSMMRVAGSFAGVKFVSEDYDRTLIGQRATLIKISEPYQKLYYPSDYFGAPPVPEFPTMGPDPALVAEVRPVPPPRPPVVRRPRVVRTRPAPTPTPEPTPAASPSPETAENSNANGNAAGNATGEKAGANADAKTEEELNRLAQQNKTPRPEKVVNTKPLTDVVDLAKKMKADGRINLGAGIEMTAEADRKEDGTLENLKITGAAGDQNIYELAQRFVSALNESRALVFLEGTRHLVMSIKLDQQTIFISLMTEADSEARAAEMAKGYGGMVGIARLSKKGKDEAKIWENMNISADGKQVVMKFQMPREMAGELLEKVQPGQS